MRISTLAQSLASQNSILDLQQKISIVREQITTGKQSSSYGGLKGEDARFSVRLRETVETKDSFIDTIEKTQLRAQVLETTLVKITDLITEVRTELINQQPGLYPDQVPVMNQFADGAIDRLAGLLNTKVDGRFLFSGFGTTTQPMITTSTVKAAYTQPALSGGVAAINTAAATFFATNTNWNSLNALTPNTEQFSINVDVGVTLSYGETAHEDGFEEVEEILYMFSKVAFTAGDDANYESLVTGGLTRIEAAFDTINQMVADVGTFRKRIGEIETGHRDDIVIIGGQLHAIENADPFETAITFQTLQGQLESSFQTTASLRRLSLTQFI